MRPKPTSIRLAVCAALGVVALAPMVASAAVLPNGVYQATINVTPLRVIAGIGTFAKPGSDGAWNSTFTFGGGPTAKSNYMTDNATDIATNPANQTGPFYGSSKLGGGAGSWDMNVNNGTFTASNFQVDAIFGTAGGTFVQYGTIPGGTIDQTSGAMTLDPSGRLGAVNGPIDTTTGDIVLYNEPWSIPPSTATNPTTDTPVNANTGYAEFTTGTTTNSGIGSGPITGHDIVANSNGTYNVILVSAGNVGTAWGTFGGASYMETWNVNLKPLLIAVNDTASTPPGVPKLIDVEKNDTIGSGVTPTIVLLPSTNVNGATLAVSSGKVSYTALSGYTGTDTFQYELKDSQGDTTPPATVTVTVAAVVTATNDTANVPEGGQVTIPVLKNDSGATSATVTISTQPTHGSATANSSNQVVYTPTSGYVGKDTFSYTATVGSSSSTATVTVTVNAAFQAATPGVSVGPGTIATNKGTSGLVTPQQLLAAKKPIPLDSGVSQQCIGGCFDFKVTGVGAGGQAKLAMLPLSKPIPSSGAPRLRKYINGKWQDFVTSNGDSVASAPGSATSCPPPSSASYKTGLTAGDYCVRLTITDGGPNDSDGIANGAITDPSGIATGTGGFTGSGGCTLGTDTNPWHGGSWWIIGTMIGWLGFTRRRRSSRRA